MKSATKTDREGANKAGQPRRYPAEKKSQVAPKAEGSAPTRKVFSILKTVAKADRPLSLSELTSLLNVPKPTIHRILHVLENDGLLEREDGGRRFGAGRLLLEFAFDIIASSVRRAPRHIILEALSRRIGETCNLGIMISNQVVYIDRVESKWPFGLRFEPGSRVPLHCTAIGKLFLSSLPHERRASVIGAISLDRYTGNTITNPRELTGELERIERAGFATDNQEFLAGVVCLALPVRNAAGQLIAGLAISAPDARLNLKKALQHVPTLRAAAMQLAKTFDVDGSA
ncbi:MAG: IclR family transcriptional regulator [Hyphomicrobiales bacterium]|nr:IclR family transcriptional regulator [Hyphomicrobiales bacterium]